MAKESKHHDLAPGFAIKKRRKIVLLIMIYSVFCSEFLGTFLKHVCRHDREK